jgi:uncharacterized protein YndB with AHSA1/START domain
MVTFVNLAAGEGEHMQDTRSPIAPAVDKVIHISALVAAPPAKAFAYFIKPALLTQWLTAAADVEERVGGKYELFWQPDDRENNSTIGCRLTAFAPEQLLAFQWRSPKQFKPFANTCCRHFCARGVRNTRPPDSLRLARQRGVAGGPRLAGEGVDRGI